MTSGPEREAPLVPAPSASAAGPASAPASAAGPASAPASAAGPASAPASAAGPAAGGRRLHPFTPLRRAWVPIAATVGVIAQQGDQAQKWMADLSVLLRLLALAGVVLVFAVYGFLSWWFTHYAVTDTELRIRTGLLFRRTAHIRLDRLQAVDVTRPLLARLTGVASLRLDVIGTDDKDQLSFLGEKEAVALRAELLARAAGFAPEEAVRLGEAPDRELLRVSPRELAVSLLLSLGVLAALAAGVVGPVAVWWFSSSPWAAVVALLPLLGAVWAATAGRFLAEYDWRVAESPDGLRLDHGMLDRAHETVPPGRVQSVRIVEPLLWRRRGRVRVELAVAGSKNEVLVPVASRAAAYAVIARVLPGVDLEALSFSGSPRAGSRWVVPVWWKGYALAVSPEVFAARHGRLCRRTEIVPHAKVQSVRLTQGPWTRARGLADVHVDTGANGTVTARLRGADEAAALLAAQAVRARTSRASARPDRWMTGPAA
ncbi:PH domain-containing protein [Streptomyces sp. MB09-01]|uniref:PH domain-containing protein n=1 Tax=Streptomyces sp. MB09-01 TaxID=3028666 RepID=UPI0029A29314|nr:PH domain-containing protein [Streptomyces sp. MB09-01]MDX3536517.1 PH domain-containing protein [Streptomyces sp. MB09-01]